MKSNIPNKKRKLLLVSIALLLIGGASLLAQAGNETGWKYTVQGGYSLESAAYESRRYWQQVAEENDLLYYQQLFDYSMNPSYAEIVERALVSDPLQIKGIAVATDQKAGNASDFSFAVEDLFVSKGSKKGIYNASWDYTVPWVSAEVPGAAAINKSIQVFFDVDPEVRVKEFAGQVASYKIYYEFARENGICALNIFEEVSANGRLDETTVRSYYYDENKGKLLSKNEYLTCMGWTTENLMDEFLNRYGKELLEPEVLREKLYSYGDLLYFYFSEEGNELQFVNVDVSLHRLESICETLAFQQKGGAQ